MNRCKCCGERPTVPQRTICDRCIAFGCLISDGCRRSLSDQEDYPPLAPVWADKAAYRKPDTPIPDGVDGRI